MNAPNRHPLEVLDSLPSPSSSAPAREAGGESIIQDWRPLTETVEWLLSNRTWARKGVAPFVAGNVPHVVNNVAWVAENAAAVLLANLRERSAQPDRVRVLELGAGLGLFARQFLDSFREISQGGGEYERLTYCVTDGSNPTVQCWIDANLFHGHDPRVELVACDALNPTVSGPFDLVIANYLLDTLPATIVRPGAEGHETDYLEMKVRTRLDASARNEVGQRFRIDARRIREYVEALTSTREPQDGTDAAAELMRLLPYFSYEISYAPPARPLRHLDLLRELDPRGKSVLNEGALDCLDSAMRLLTPDGLILYRDLGPTNAESMAELSYAARFGTTVAVTLNFPLIDRHLRSRGFQVIAPREDDHRTIHTRLAFRGPLPETEATFRTRFDEDRYGLADAAASEALKQIHELEFDRALASYRRALQLCPNDWQLLGQVAQFLTQQMLRAPEALELVELAIQINPAFSPFLWNTLGNCRFVMGDVAEAHRAYLRAREIDPRDIQAHLNLSYTYAAMGQLDEALLEIAQGLACDSDGHFEFSLLSKQREILIRLDQRRRDLAARSEARNQTFTSLP